MKRSDSEWSQRTSNLIVAWSTRTSLRKWHLSEGLQKPCEIPPPYFSTLPYCSAPAAMLNASLCPSVPAFALTVLSAGRAKHKAKCEKRPEVGKTILKNCSWRWDIGRLLVVDVVRKGLGRNSLSKMLFRFTPLAGLSFICLHPEFLLTSHSVLLEAVGFGNQTHPVLNFNSIT